MKQYPLPLGNIPVPTIQPETVSPMPTLSEFTERWLQEYAGPPYRARYIQKARRQCLGIYLLPTIGHMRLAEITPAIVSQVQRDLLTRGLAHSTVKTTIGVFAEVWKGARREGLVLGRPHAELVWPKRARKKPTVFTSEERDRIIRACAEHRQEFLPLVATSFLAGLRPSEAAGLRWGDVDLDTGRIEISRALVHREVTNGKTEKSLRSIVMSPRLTKLLTECRPVAAKQHTLMSRNAWDQPIDSKNFSPYAFRTLLERVGIPYRSFYAARHTYITLSLMAGANATELAEYCGTSIPEIERSYLSWIGAVEDPTRHARKRDVARAGRKLITASWDTEEHHENA